VAQTPNAGPSTEPPPAKRPRKEKRAPQHSAPGPVLSRSNPDSSQTVVTDRPATSRRRPSPSYAPRSPITQTRPPDWSRSNGLANGHAEPSGGEYDDVDGFGYGQSEGVNGGVRTSAVAPEPRSGSSSMIGVQATVGISADDALVYAMTAQYWAGYWMGVSQSKSSSSISPQAAQMADPVLTAPGVPAGGSSNVFVTRQQFYRPDRSDGAGLRR